MGKKTNTGAVLATLFCKEPNVDRVGKKTNIGAALATLFCREPNVDNVGKKTYHVATNVDRVGKKTNIGAALATLVCREPNVDNVGKKTCGSQMLTEWARPVLVQPWPLSSAESQMWVMWARRPRLVQPWPLFCREPNEENMDKHVTFATFFWS